MAVQDNLDIIFYNHSRCPKDIGSFSLSLVTPEVVVIITTDVNSGEDGIKTILGFQCSRWRVADNACYIVLLQTKDS